MAANRLEAMKAPEEARNGQDKVQAGASAGGSGGGMKSWLPLILNIVLMPVIAYGITNFVLLPKIQGTHTETEATESGHGGESASGNPGASKKVSAPLSGKILVNVAGTAGTRYLVANMTLVGKVSDLKARVDQNDAELRDVASSILSGKTISDLEKPGMRNIIRAELIAAFNDILGKDVVNEIYLTEFAVQ
ncbi:MAG: flagellar basal body-associated FliL family protein [Verrucomicrobiota bacterium]